MAAEQGVDIGLVERDPDKSGADPKRKKLLRLIQRVENRESGGIIVAKLDRFARKMWVATTLAQRVIDAGGEILPWAERADWTTPSGRLQINIVWVFAEYERDRRSEDLEASKKAAVEEGIPVRPLMPPGLRLTHKRNRHDELVRTGAEHDPDVAPIMAEFFERRARGAGPTELGEFLTENGVRTATGSEKWSKQLVYDLLKNVAYVGVLKEGPYEKENAWEPIVDRTTFKAAQNPTQRKPVRPRAKDGQVADLLVGLVRCGSCRYVLQATAHSRGHRIYRCTGAAGECPDRARANVDDLDPLVLDAFWGLVRDHHAHGSHLADTDEVDRLRAEAERVEREWLAWRDDPDREATIQALGGLSEWREATDTRRLRRDAAHAAVGRVEARLRSAPEVPLESTLRSEWEDMDARERREVLATLIDTVALLPRSTGLPLDERVIVFAAGHGPGDLPTRGHLARPAVRPFDLPAGTGVTALKPVGAEAA
jgi:DNA invertase Pin-like site-specific DNA recombinase